MASLATGSAAYKSVEAENSNFSSVSRTEFMLAVLRSARIRVQTLASEIDEIGISLKHGMISPEAAVVWCDHIGATAFMPLEINGGLIRVEDAA